MIYKQKYYRVPENYEMKLTLNHTELSDDSKFLIEYKVKNEDTIKLELINPILKLNVRYMDEVYELNVINNPTISDFKALIKQYIETTEFNPDQHLNKVIDKDFELYYNNMRLIDTNPISYYNIMNNSNIDVCDHFINLTVKTLDGKTIYINVKEDETIRNVKWVIANKLNYSCPDDFRLLFNHRNINYIQYDSEEENTLKTYNITNNSTLHLVLPLRGGKPVILFYPPKDCKELEVKTVLDLHPECKYTTLLPKPEKDGNVVIWNGTVKNNSETSDIIINGRKYKYLFYEFKNEYTGYTDYINELIGVQSIRDHFDESYLINGLDEYEEWCYKILSKIGLKEKDIDDFMTFWANNVYENGPYVITRIVPEIDLEKCCNLNVKTSDVKINIRRVYISMIICKKLPKWIKTDEMINWKKEDSDKENKLIPEYFIPIEYYDDQLNVIEWGGMLSII